MFRFGAGLSGEMLILIAAVIAGVKPIFFKGLYTLGMQPMDVLTWRFIIAVPAIWLLTLWIERGKKQPEVPPKPLPRRNLLLVGVLFAGVSTVGFWGLAVMPAGTWLVLSYAYPAVVALFGLFMGERLASRAWFALALTLVGVVLTVPNLQAGLQGASAFNLAMGIFNAVIVSIHIIATGRVLRGHGQGARATAWMFTGTLISFLVVTVVRGELMMPPSLLAWEYIFIGGTLCTAINFYVMYAGLQKIGASKTALVGTAEVPFGLVLATLLLAERMSGIQWIGAAIIVLSVILLQAPIPVRWRLGQRRVSAVPESVG